MNELISVRAAAELIRSGASLSLAGPESALDQLPIGNWIGGTIPYFMVAAGGTEVTEGQVFATDLTHVGQVRIARYAADDLAEIVKHAPDNGFSLTIIPAGSHSHERFAAEAANNPDAFLKPTVGWISGVHLAAIGTASPKVYDGRSATKHEDCAVVAYVSLPANRMASIEIVNLFEPDDGDVLRFSETSFHVDHCEVNGERALFSQYLRSRGMDHGKVPLVGDFAGAHVNVSLQRIDDATGVVHMYAPLFAGVDYRLAKPVADYAGAFRERLANVDKAGIVMSCNCVLNFVYGELLGKPIGGAHGPVTFGEIAYQLLNQTTVMIRVN